MKSTSASRFATFALSLFLSSRDHDIGSSSFVESFHVPPSQTSFARNQHHYSSSQQQKHVKYTHKTRFQLQVANPPTDQDIKSYNNTTSLADPGSLAQAEASWALETTGPVDLIDEDIIEEVDVPFQDKLLTAEVLGPVLTVTFTILFLFNTLINGDGISEGFPTESFTQKLECLSRISWFPNRLNDAEVVVGLVMAFSSFAQALTGFGFAVVAVGAMSSMPWLLHSELYDVITPVAATLGALVGFILLIPYAFMEGEPTEAEPGLDWGEILPLLIPCTVLTPLGIKLNSVVDPVLGTRILAGLIMAFVAYKLVPTIQASLGTGDNDDVIEASAEIVPQTNEAELVLESEEPQEGFLQSRTAAILLGSAAGVFGGAFDVQGPPLCVYGDAKGWSPAKFRNTVLAVVCLNSALVVALDYFDGTLGDFYYSYFCLTSLPGVLMGVVAGQYASKRIDPVLFKNLVLVMCLGLGIQLLRVS